MDHQARIIRSLAARHLEESAFALRQFESGLVSPSTPWHRLAGGAENSFLAHVDALVIGGGPVVEEVLRPALAAKKPLSEHHAAAIVTTCLRSGRAPLAIQALTHDAPEARRGALRGCALAAVPLLDQWIVQSLANGFPIARRSLLELANERTLPVASLRQSLDAEEPEERIAALRLTWRAPERAFEERLRAMLDDPHPGVRDAALLAALHHGSFEAWAMCQQLALSSASAHPLAMVLVAGLGEPGQHRRLAQMADENGALRLHALRALGFSGNLDALPVLLKYAQSEDQPLADVAAEAVATILGPGGDRFVASEADRTDWVELWNVSRLKLQPGRRYLAGRPLSHAAFAHALTHFPGKRRFLLSLLLSIRTAGASRVSTRAASAIQRAQLFALSSNQPDGRWAREFSAF